MTRKFKAKLGKLLLLQNTRERETETETDRVREKQRESERERQRGTKTGREGGNKKRGVLLFRNSWQTCQIMAHGAEPSHQSELPASLYLQALSWILFISLISNIN